MSGLAFVEEPEKDLDYYIRLDRESRRWERQTGSILELVEQIKQSFDFQRERLREELELGDYLFKDLRQKSNLQTSFRALSVLSFLIQL